MTTQQTTGDYTGLTINVVDDLGSMETWLGIGSEENETDPVDFEASVDRYAARLREELTEMFPGIAVTYQLANGGGRTTVSGPDDHPMYIEQDDLAQALDTVFEYVCPHGNPDTIIVLADGTPA